MSGVGGGDWGEGRDSHLCEPRSEAERDPQKPSYEVVQDNESKSLCDVISSSARQSDITAGSIGAQFATPERNSRRKISPPKSQWRGTRV
jgi:hypothetical protein